MMKHALYFGLAFALSTPAFAAPAVNAKPKLLVRDAGGADTARDTTEDERHERARKLAGHETDDAKIAKSVTLSVRQPFVDDHTYLELGSSSVSFVDGLAYVGGGDSYGYVSLRFRGKPDHAYMIDCVVGGVMRLDMAAIAYEEKGKKLISRGTLDETFSVDDNHVYFLLTPTKAKRWRDVMLYNANDLPWTFRSCEVTSIAP